MIPSQRTPPGVTDQLAALAATCQALRESHQDHETRLRALEQWSAGLRGQLGLVVAIAGVAGSTVGAIVAGLTTYALTH